MSPCSPQRTRGHLFPSPAGFQEAGQDGGGRGGGAGRDPSPTPTPRGLGFPFRSLPSGKTSREKASRNAGCEAERGRPSEEETHSTASMGYLSANPQQAVCQGCSDHAQHTHTEPRTADGQRGPSFGVCQDLRKSQHTTSRASMALQGLFRPGKPRGQRGFRPCQTLPPNANSQGQARPKT